MSIHRQMDKEVMVHIFNGMLFSNEKNEILPFVTTWVDLEGIMLVNKPDRKDKYHMTSFIRGI